MANTYLIVDFKEKDAAKALGARWDGAQRQWYVPEGRELAPFAQWLPANSGATAQASARQLATVSAGGVELSVPGQKGVSLSSLLAGVSQAVAQAYRAGVWVLVEVVELRSNGGHVFMGVSERGSGGSVLAKTSAVIWQSTANTILPEFERATGAQLAPGIKLLVRARPVFKPLHGFSIEIDAIDPEYTLGDLEARKREIRERLQAEGVFTANKNWQHPGISTKFWSWRRLVVPGLVTSKQKPIASNSSVSATLSTRTADFKVKALPKRFAMHCRWRCLNGQDKAGADPMRLSSFVAAVP